MVFKMPFDDLAEQDPALTGESSRIGEVRKLEAADMLAALQNAKAAEQAAPDPHLQAKAPGMAPEAPMIPPASAPQLSPPSIYGADLDDAALKAAQEERKQAERDALLTKGAALFGSGVGGMLGKTAPTDTSKAEALAAERAKIEGNKVTEIEERRKGKKSELEFANLRDEYGDKTKMRNADSEVSKFARSEFQRMFGKAVPDSVSAEQMRDAGYNLGTLLGIKETAEARKEAAKAGREDRALMRQQMLNQKNIQNIDKLQTNFNKDKVGMAANEGLAAANMAESLLDNDSPIADSAIKRQLARLSGEVGVMTDQDVASFGGSQAIKDKLSQSIKMMTDGKLTKQNKDYMRKLIDTMKARREAQLVERAEFHAEQGAKRLGISKEEALDNILPGHDTIKKVTQKASQPAQAPQAAPAGMVKVRNKATGQSGNIPAENLEKALASGKYEKI